MWEPAVFGYFFPRKKVTRRKGGRGPKRHQIEWINPNAQRLYTEHTQKTGASRGRRRTGRKGLRSGPSFLTDWH
ncbi:hypothetical protein PSRE111525_16270 [Pseudomonas reidholzensis]